MLNRKNAVLFVILTVMLSASLLVSSCFASGDGLVTMKLSENRRVYSTETLDSNQELASAYLGRIMPSKRRNMLRARAALQGAKLSGTPSVFYSLLHDDIASVASGDRASTVFAYDASTVYGTASYTATDLGVESILDENGDFRPETTQAIDSIIYFDVDSVISALMLDCPYELYWYDKTIGFVVEFPGEISTDGETLEIGGNVTAYLRVSSDYSLNGEAYQCDTTYGQSAKAAAAAARAIVNQYADASDQDKLTGYANEICALTSYNFDALGENVSYGNPWQLIWVFDGNPNTNVVCEGYAKAFQYLCDLTTFTDNTSVNTVTGTMNGGTGAGAHMWNIVKLADGNNYLVDVTNIDEETIGCPDQLMLVGSSSGNILDGYKIITSNGEIEYKYDVETIEQYSESEVILYGSNRILENVVAYGSTRTGQMWFVYDDGLLYIWGTGVCNPVSQDTGWGIYYESINKIIFSKGITALGGCASCTGYPELEEVDLPNTLIDLDILFSSNPKLKSVELNEGLRNIGMHCFEGCTNLSSISIPDSVNQIGEAAFQDCKSITSVSITHGAIDDWAFAGCENLTDVTLGDDVSSIGLGAFAYCSSLASIALPPALQSLGRMAFYSCISLSGEVVIPQSISVIEPQVFTQCNISSVVLPETMTSIGAEAFRGSALSSVTIPNAVASIGDMAFRECGNLSSIVWGSGIKVIGQDAFAQCGLTTLTIPASVESILFFSKGLSDTLQYVYVDDNNANYCDIDGILYNKEQTSLIYCPGGRTGAIQVPNGVTEICDYAFSYCDQLAEILLPESVTRIGIWAIELCSNLASLHLPDSLQEIPDYMCYGCENLQNVDLPDALAVIGKEAFAGCRSLLSLFIPENVRTIGSNAFRNCPNLTLTFDSNNPYFTSLSGFVLSKDGKTLVVAETSICGDIIHVPNGIQTIADGCFSSNSSLLEVYFPDSVTTIGDSAFAYCTNLHTVEFGNGIAVISDYAFESCSSLEQISLTGNNITIGSAAFNNCHALESIAIEGSVKSLGGGAFRECRSLRIVNINSIVQNAGGSIFEFTPYSEDESNRVNGLLIVGNWVVDGKNAVGQVSIPQGVIGISSFAFSENRNITELNSSGGIQYIGENAFENCTELKGLNIGNDLMNIGQGALSGTDVRAIVLSETPSYIGYNFWYTPKWFFNKTIVFNGDAPSFDNNAFLNAAPLTVYYPCNNVTWRNLAGSQFGAGPVTINSMIIDGVTWIPYNPSTGSTFIPDSIFPLYLTTIEDEAFEGCTFKSVKLPETLQSIGENAFAYSSTLEEIYIPSGCQTIASSAFTECSNLTIIGHEGSKAYEFAMLYGFPFTDINDMKMPN